MSVATQQPPSGSDQDADVDRWIEIHDLDKVYRSRKSAPVIALQGIGFTVRQGEFVSLVGPSGCGKTTMLKILAGLIPKTAGTARLAGEEIEGSRRDIGMVFQAATLLPWRTILENVMLPIDVQRLDKKHYRARALELLDMVGLEGFEGRYPRELSGGMQQRAGICRALVHDPDVLLMDEPFGALDAMTREYMNLELLRIWRESGKTIVLVTHSIPEAVFLSDRVVVMSPRPGRMVELVDIELERPRGLELMQSDAAGAYVQRIRKHFNAAGVVD